jgi:hypothetical protein
VLYDDEAESVEHHQQHHPLTRMILPIFDLYILAA